MTSQDVAGQENPENQGENQEEEAQLSSEVTRQCIEITERFRAGTLAKVSAISSSSQQSRTTTSQLISRLSAPMSVSSTTSSASVAGLNPEELRVMRMVSQVRENAKIVQEVALLDRISDRGCSLLDRMTDQPSAKSTSVHSRGSYATGSTHHRFRHPSFGCRQPSKISLETRNSPRPHSSTLPDYHSSPTQSGPISSQGVPLTSTMSSPVSTLSPTMIATLSTSESLNSSLDLPNQPGLLTLTGNGSSLGIRQLMPQPSSSLTEHQSCENMGGTSPSYLHPSPMHFTRASSSTTEQSEFVSPRDETFYSRTTTISQTSTSSGSKMPVPMEPGAGDGDKRTRSGGGSASNSKRRETCRRWNEGRCPNRVTTCKCHSSSHTSSECKQ
jgi:hypothetical protein